MASGGTTVGRTHDWGDDLADDGKRLSTVELAYMIADKYDVCSVAVTTCRVGEDVTVRYDVRHDAVERDELTDVLRGVTEPATP